MAEPMFEPSEEATCGRLSPPGSSAMKMPRHSFKASLVSHCVPQPSTRNSAHARGVSVAEAAEDAGSPSGIFSGESDHSFPTRQGASFGQGYYNATVADGRCCRQR
eukprot:493339-Prymnesium_polylepis.3